MVKSSKFYFESCFIISKEQHFAESSLGFLKKTWFFSKVTKSIWIDNKTVSSTQSFSVLSCYGNRVYVWVYVSLDQIWRLASSTFKQDSTNSKAEQFSKSSNNTTMFSCVKHTKLIGSYDKSKSAFTVFSDWWCCDLSFSPFWGGKICQLSAVRSTLTLTENKRDCDLYNSPKFSSRNNLPPSVWGLAVWFSWNFPLAFYLHRVIQWLSMVLTSSSRKHWNVGKGQF